MSTIIGTTLNADTIRKTGGSLGTDIRVKNTSVYESDGGTSVTQNLVQGLAKAWGQLNYGTGSFADSFNNSSATDFQTGSFNHNFTNVFANSSYCISGSHNLPSGNTASIVIGFDNSSRFLTSSVSVAAFNASNGRVDATRVCTKVTGDLA